MIEQIRPAELSTWLSRHHGDVPPVVLDVREPIEWRVTTIRGSRFTFVADWTAGQRNELRLAMLTG